MENPTATKSKSENRSTSFDEVLDRIRKTIESMRYGTVQIVVQDGKVVQIDKTEKIRLV